MERRRKHKRPAEGVIESLEDQRRKSERQSIYRDRREGKVSVTNAQGRGTINNSSVN